MLRKTSMAIAIALSLATLSSTVPVSASSVIEKSIGQQQKVMAQELIQGTSTSKKESPLGCRPIPYWPWCI